MKPLDDNFYMERALQLARNGALHASPNPMVGAVIVDPKGRIIGEGWHHRCGEPHAEVNAVADAGRFADITDCTFYVTLEPCSHYGKTPPCAELLIKHRPARVVVAMLDPFPAVAGRGVAMLKEAGIPVTVGVMEEEARRLNRKFITAHTLHRPFVTLKWAQSADGYIDGRKSPDAPAAAISTPETITAVHRLRATHDAILIGSNTWLTDRPQLTVRHYAGASPRRYVADRRQRLTDLPEDFTALSDPTPEALLKHLHADGITSVLVEGGAMLLQSFIDAKLYDDLAIETNSELTLGGFPIRTRAPKV